MNSALKELLSLLNRVASQQLQNLSASNGELQHHPPQPKMNFKENQLNDSSDTSQLPPFLSELLEKKRR
jgi:hypothetical protein